MVRLAVSPLFLATLTIPTPSKVASKSRHTKLILSTKKVLRSSQENLLFRAMPRQPTISLFEPILVDGLGEVATAITINIDQITPERRTLQVKYLNRQFLKASLSNFNSKGNGIHINDYW